MRTGDPAAQFLRGFTGGCEQLGCTKECALDQERGLLRRETESDGSASELLDQIKHVGRARARDSAHLVDFGLRHLDHDTYRREERACHCDVGGARPAARSQSGHPAADDGWGVGHGPQHRNRRRQQRLNSANGDAGGDTDENRIRFQRGADFAQQVWHHVGLDRHHHDARASDRGKIRVRLHFGGVADYVVRAQGCRLRLGAIRDADVTAHRRSGLNKAIQNGAAHRSRP